MDFKSSNDNANLRHHTTSLKGKVVDYILTFKREECNIHCIIECSEDLFYRLIDQFKANSREIKCSLCARVKYFRQTFSSYKQISWWL